jgi:hypothetical protein
VAEKMITDDQLDELPEDDRDAFLAYETICRKWVDDHKTSANWAAERQYVTHILAFADARDVGLSLDGEIPDDDEEFADYFSGLLSQVDRFRAKVRVELAAARKTSGTSFHIARNFKTQIGGHLTAIRKIVQDATLSDSKREAIFNRIEKLQAEVNRDRTKTESAIGLWLDITSAISHGAEKLDPAIERLEKIMKVFAEARDEATVRLPAPAEQKRLPKPKSQPNEDDA